MRLIRVAAMLDIEARIHQGKEVNTTTEIFGEFYGPALTAKQYAILSHCWGVWERDEREVSFKEMNKLLVKGEVKRDEIRGRTGYKKIIDTCRQAQKDELEWVWIDTCCINKDSSSELSEAINSMYKWYAQAKLCYTYLHDTVGNSWTNREEWRSTPKWFSRGWTLQELIAPKVVHFFDREWKWIGNKAELANALSRITGIPQRVLNEGLQKASSSEDDFERPSVAQIISWAARRTTTREEDRAYSLLGLLGVHMPMLYGEGKNAFRRLQLEIIRTSNDQSIFAWGFRTRQSGWSSSVLADDPSCFVDCRQIIVRRSEQLTEHLRKNGMPDEELSKFTQKRLHTFTVTNGGIQIWLPTVTAGLFSKVKLACCESNWDFITIDLVFRDSTCFRTFNLPKPPGQIEFKQHLLPYKEAEYPSTFTFKLQDQKLSQGGFVLDCVYPEEGEVEVEDGLVTLSSDYDFAALAYVRGNDATCFYVLLSYFAGGHSAFALLHPENFVYSPARSRYAPIATYPLSWINRGYKGGPWGTI
ncbi:heterokaryon incompatibility protein-domain-containing protein [Pisolithus marmoratus]|nr:heterokaryon incompatibility protein-domain-containing protein [Pisolithus marmoratus]